MEDDWLQRMDWMLALSGRQEYEKGWEKIDESTYQYDEGGVRFFLLMGKKEALLIDSGMQTHNAKELVKELTDLPVRLFNTHTDVDHVGSNEEFDEVY